MNLHWPHNLIDISSFNILMHLDTSMHLQCVASYIFYITAQSTRLHFQQLIQAVRQIWSPFLLLESASEVTLSATYWFSICGAAHPVHSLKTVHQWIAWCYTCQHSGGSVAFSPSEKPTKKTSNLLTQRGGGASRKSLIRLCSVTCKQECEYAPSNSCKHLNQNIILFRIRSIVELLQQM